MMRINKVAEANKALKYAAGIVEDNNVTPAFKAMFALSKQLKDAKDSRKLEALVNNKEVNLSPCYAVMYSMYSVNSAKLYIISYS